MKSKACAHCICSVCEDVGCAECAMCRGRYKTDSCSEVFITPKKNRARSKTYSIDKNLRQQLVVDEYKSSRERGKLKHEEGPFSDRRFKVAIFQDRRRVD